MSDSAIPAVPGLKSLARRAGGTAVPRTPSERPGRVVGVDVARGIALIGMMAVHVFATFDRRGAPTLATVLAGGRSATTFVLVAGVSLALLSGGRRVVEGRARTAAAAGIAVRALLIGAIGLWLGSAAPEAEVILPYYAVLFVLAIPLLGLPPRTLTVVTTALVAVAPLVVLVTFNAWHSSARAASNPTFDTLVDDPAGLTVGLLVTGTYPALAYLAYLCAGLALGRLDLTSRRLAAWLFGGGLCLAITAQIVSDVLLFRLGGIRHLLDADLSSSDPVTAHNVLLWEPAPTSSWWYLALPAPHSTTPVDMARTLGSAMAVLGAALLLSRVPAVARLLRPLAAAGAMTLTLYCAHLLVLATGVFSDAPVMLYILMVVGALTFGLAWQRWLGQGPLERLVAAAAGRARRTVAARTGAGRPR
ncbi:MAG: heparan-alpha-glucosaminide N-acetyltransferase domain-containing protein [Actinomycetota bacterium]|nr:heparan-alpha-glucosaminide N-acetyltransferase domain-containing protein [Actinomycetota bacterium]